MPDKPWRSLRTWRFKLFFMNRQERYVREAALP
jgi:hypothetical protein